MKSIWKNFFLKAVEAARREMKHQLKNSPITENPNAPDFGMDCNEKISCFLGCVSGITESMPHRIKNAVRSGGTALSFYVKIKGVKTVAVRVGSKSLGYYGMAITAYDLKRCSQKCASVKCNPCNKR